jgi:hypothetical protein
MSKSWLQKYKQQIELIIPVYCAVSFWQDAEKIGKSSASYLIYSAVEYFTTGSITNTLKKTHGATNDDRILTEKILEDFIQLYANQNLIIIVCHRIEILKEQDNSVNGISRDQVNQLVKLYNNISGKLPFKLFRLNPIKKIKVRVGIGSLMLLDSGKVELVDLTKIDMNEVRTSLERIKI